jgi:hypothetical protein
MPQKAQAVVDRAQLKQAIRFLIELGTELEHSDSREADDTDARVFRALSRIAKTEQFLTATVERVLQHRKKREDLVRVVRGVDCATAILEMARPKQPDEVHAARIRQEADLRGIDLTDEQIGSVASTARPQARPSKSRSSRSRRTPLTDVFAALVGGNESDEHLRRIRRALRGARTSGRIKTPEDAEVSVYLSVAPSAAAAYAADLFRVEAGTGKSP